MISFNLKINSGGKTIHAYTLQMKKLRLGKVAHRGYVFEVIRYQPRVLLLQTELQGSKQSMEFADSQSEELMVHLSHRFIL